MEEIDKKKEKVLKDYDKKLEKAKLLLEDTHKTEEKLNKAYDKTKNSTDKNINKVFEDIILLIEIVKAWTKKEYREIPLGSITAIFGAIVYFVSPIDAIFDYIPGIGFIDDAFVIGFVINKVDSDLQKFKFWKEEKKLS